MCSFSDFRQRLRTVFTARSMTTVMPLHVPVQDDQERLAKFVRCIPKVELHAHLNGCIRDRTLLELAQERNVTLSSRHVAPLNQESHSNSPQKSIAHHNGGLYNIRPRSLLDCFDMFAEITKAVDDLAALQRITEEALEDFARHHVAYLELRSTPKCLLRKHDNKADASTKKDYIETILSVMKSFEQKELERYQKRECSDILCKLPLLPRFIVSIDRSGSVQEAIENAQLAISLFQKGNPYIVGVDLGGNPTKNDFSDFADIFQMVRDAGLKVTVHCGEAISEKSNRETEAVLRFRPDRLGHALLVPDVLRPLMSQLRIPVECCPTSNVMTLELATHFDGNLVEGLKRHPQLEHWIESDHPLSISTDDSGVFHTNASQELLLLASAWNLCQDRIRRLVLQSLKHAFCKEDTIALLETQFLSQFQAIETYLEMNEII